MMPTTGAHTVSATAPPATAAAVIPLRRAVRLSVSTRDPMGITLPEDSRRGKRTTLLRFTWMRGAAEIPEIPESYGGAGPAPGGRALLFAGLLLVVAGGSAVAYALGSRGGPPAS